MAVTEEKLNNLLGRFLHDFGATFHSVLAVVGDKLGLYKAGGARRLAMSDYSTDANQA